MYYQDYNLYFSNYIFCTKENISMKFLSRIEFNDGRLQIVYYNDTRQGSQKNSTYSRSLLHNKIIRYILQRKTMDSLGELK